MNVQITGFKQTDNGMFQVSLRGGYVAHGSEGVIKMIVASENLEQ